MYSSKNHFGWDIFAGKQLHLGIRASNYVKQSSTDNRYLLSRIPEYTLIQALPNELYI